MFDILGQGHIMHALGRDAIDILVFVLSSLATRRRFHPEGFVFTRAHGTKEGGKRAGWDPPFSLYLSFFLKPTPSLNFFSMQTPANRLTFQYGQVLITKNLCSITFYFFTKSERTKKNMTNTTTCKLCRHVDSSTVL